MILNHRPQAKTTVKSFEILFDTLKSKLKNRHQMSESLNGRQM
jgi:hypothetical protein